VVSSVEKWIWEKVLGKVNVVIIVIHRKVLV